jgi:hypothetical protein
MSDPFAIAWRHRFAARSFNAPRAGFGHRTKAVLSVVLVVFFCLAAGLRADSSLERARDAQTLLGPDIWTQVIRIENSSYFGAYPRTFHALVFEFAGLLWFYTERDGTQNLSLHFERLQAEKADIGPLLRAIDPGFVRWSVVPDQPLRPLAKPGATLRNGCFIECIAAMRRLPAQHGSAENPQLLSYSMRRRHGEVGHTVLTYTIGTTRAVFDPARPRKTLTFPRLSQADPLTLARAIENGDITRAYYVRPQAAPSPATIVPSGRGARDARADMRRERARACGRLSGVPPDGAGVACRPERHAPRPSCSFACGDGIEKADLRRTVRQGRQ